MDENNPDRQTFYAYAKINLSLEVLGKRPDRYHELASVMQTIGLYDTLYFAPAPDLQFDSNQPELVEEGNLVWQAALLMHEVCEEGNKRGADIYLEKTIPVSAGLGGGSSDAAVTLLALNRLWDLNLTEEQLMILASRLGSDVPFFLKGGTALVEGRGEKLTHLPPLPRSWLVLFFPQLELPASKTAELYRMLDRNDYSSGGVTRALVRSIQRGEPPEQSLLYNSFERAVYQRFPQMDMFRQAMVDAGANYVRVSGSGPTIYTMTEDEAEAQKIAANLTEKGYLAYAVSTVQP